MAYLTAADFRENTPAEYCSGLLLSEAEAATTALTAAIARLSSRIDELTNDHYESRTLTYDLDVYGYSGVVLLPERCTALTTVKTTWYGTQTTQASTAYSLHSSLDTAGAKRIGDHDWIEVVTDTGGLVGTMYTYAWPIGPATVEVTGSFGWVTTPADIKRAVALMVWDHFKPQQDTLRRAVRWTAQGETFEAAASQPTGIPEVDQLIAEYRREDVVVV